MVVVLPPKHFYFYSGAKDPYYKLSNFYRPPDHDTTVVWPSDAAWVPLFLRGVACVYATREHAYQSLRSADLATAKMFMVGGAFSSWTAFATWPKRSGKPDATCDIMAKKEAHWNRKSMLGVIAKMAVGLPAARACAVFGARFVSPTSRRDDDTDWEVWRLILESYFARGTPMWQTLKATGDEILVEFQKGTKEKSRYSRLYRPDGSYVGRNRMGKYLCFVRSLNKK